MFLSSGVVQGRPGGTRSNVPREKTLRRPLRSSLGFCFCCSGCCLGCCKSLSCKLSSKCTKYIPFLIRWWERVGCLRCRGSRRSRAVDRRTGPIHRACPVTWYDTLRLDMCLSQSEPFILYFVPFTLFRPRATLNGESSWNGI